MSKDFPLFVITDAAKEAIAIYVKDAFGEMPCRVCLEKVLNPPVYTVTKWVKSPGHRPLLVRSHRVCPLITIVEVCPVIPVDRVGGFINHLSMSKIRFFRDSNPESKSGLRLESESGSGSS